MRINWFSPLPPDPSPLAEYSRQLLPFLHQRHDVTLWTDQTDPAPELAGYARVQRCDMEQMRWADLNRADVSVYHLTGDTSVKFAWDVSRLHPGVIVVHGDNLHGLYRGLHQRFGDLEGYLDRVQSWYGANALPAARKHWGGPLEDAEASHLFPFVADAASSALGLAAHSAFALKELQGRSTPCLRLNLPLRPECALKVDDYRSEAAFRARNEIYLDQMFRFIESCRRRSSRMLVGRLAAKVEAVGSAWSQVASLAALRSDLDSMLGELSGPR